jgi:hypothetical protein
MAADVTSDMPDRRQVLAGRHKGLLSAAIVIALASTGGCGDDGSVDSAPPSPFGALGEPPAIVIHAGDRTTEVVAYGFHTATAVADGTTLPPAGPAVDVSSPELVVECPLAGWTFRADVTLTGEPGGRREPLVVDSLGGGRFRLIPPPVPGTYDVWLEGTSDGSGAGFVFRWNTQPQPSTTAGSEPAHASETGTDVVEDLAIRASTEFETRGDGRFYDTGAITYCRTSTELAGGIFETLGYTAADAPSGYTLCYVTSGDRKRVALGAESPSGVTTCVVLDATDGAIKTVHPAADVPSPVELIVPTDRCSID